MTRDEMIEYVVDEGCMCEDDVIEWSDDELEEWISEFDYYKGWDGS